MMPLYEIYAKIFNPFKYQISSDKKDVEFNTIPLPLYIAMMISFFICLHFDINQYK